MPTPATLRYHAALAAARDAAIILTGEQQRLLIEILEEYAREIERLVAAGVSGRTFQAVLREVSALVDAMTGEMAGATADAIRLTARQMAEVQMLATAELIAAHGVDLAVSAAFTGTGVRAAAAVLARPELAEAFVTIRLDAKAAANRILMRGLARGAPYTAMARELRQYIVMPGSLLKGDGTLLADRRRIGYRAIEALGYEPTPENLRLVRSEASQIAHRAARIARTEVMTSQAETLIQGAIDSPVVAWIHWTLSYRHSEPCACEPIAELDLYGHGPGLYDPRNTPVRPHPHCFIPGTEVQGSFFRGFRSEYDGEVIEIHTRNGNQLTVTPNHPILTRDGFVAAGVLRDGDELLSHSGDTVAGLGPREEDEHHAPAAIEDVFGALRESFGGGLRKGSPEDLHGDAAAVQGYINVVGADWELLANVEPSAAEGVGEIVLIGSTVQEPLVSGVSGLELGGEAHFTPSLGGMRGGSDLAPGIGVSVEDADPLRSLRFGVGAKLEAVRLEAALQDPATYARLRRKLVKRLPGFVPRGECGEVGDGNATPTRGVRPVTGSHASGPQSCDDGLSREADALSDVSGRLSGLVSRNDGVHVDGLLNGQAGGLLAGADAGPGVHEALSEVLVRDSDLFAEIAERFPGLVTPDEIVHVRRYRYIGHVYDLQSDTGYLVANNIVASNCWCNLMQVLRPADRWGEPRGPLPALLVDLERTAEGLDYAPSVLRSFIDAVRAGSGRAQSTELVGV